MLISSRGQLGLNVAHLEEGQRQRLLPGREHEAPAGVTQLWPDCTQGGCKGPAAKRDTAGTLTSVSDVTAAANEDAHSNINHNSVRIEPNGEINSFIVLTKMSWDNLFLQYGLWSLNVPHVDNILDLTPCCVDMGGKCGGTSGRVNLQETRSMGGRVGVH